MTRIYFVRHGESESNLIHQFAGSLDKPLTERGKEQATLTAEYLRHIPICAVYASDLSRAAETGLAIAEVLSVPLVKTPQLREIFAGLWEGKTYSALEAEFPDSYGVWRKQIGLAMCPQGESVAQLQERIRCFVEKMVRDHPNESICIATHATPIRVMECIWNNIPLEQMHTVPWVSNASITVVEYENNHGRVIQRDIHEHLGALNTRLAGNV